MNRSIIKDICIGEYIIKNVPHVKLSRPTPTGEKIIREAKVDLKLADIYKNMKNNNQYDVDYYDF